MYLKLIFLLVEPTYSIRKVRAVKKTIMDTHEKQLWTPINEQLWKLTIIKTIMDTHKQLS